MSNECEFRLLNRAYSAAPLNEASAREIPSGASASNTNDLSGVQLRGESQVIDPAIVIGLALAFAKQRHGVDLHVPAVLLQHLEVLASRGNVACSLVMDWIDKRAARELVQRSKAEIIAASEGGADE